MFRLTKLKISTIFLNKPNFLNRKRLCLFVFWFPTFFSVAPSGGGGAMVDFLLKIFKAPFCSFSLLFTIKLYLSIY